MKYINSITNEIYVGDKQKGDIPVPVELENEAFLKVEQGVVVVDVDAQNLAVQDQINKDAREFLQNSDWMVLRHQDQLDLGIQTSLSVSEFEQLLLDRQDKRDLVI